MWLNNIHINRNNFLIFCKGLQDFCPEPGKYNIIWCQWVLSHINNNDLIKFFQNCR
jgi:protein N-terminal methyltransferase